jgi:coenzyme F420 hydrogenase subunit delta
LNRICTENNIKYKVIGCQAKYVSEPDVVLELCEEVENAVDEAVDMILADIRGN